MTAFFKMGRSGIHKRGSGDRNSLVNGIALIALVLAVQPSVAEAGGITDKIDFIHLRPFIGYEYSRVGSFDFSIQGVPSYKVDAFDLNGLAWGGYLGFRLGPFSFDALFQRTELGRTSDGRAVDMNKLYGDFGVNLGTDWLRGVIDIGGGYSFLNLQGASTRQGFGGRIGLSLDFFPVKWFSVGPTASFDVQGYTASSNTGGGVVGAYGATFTGRIGFHL